MKKIYYLSGAVALALIALGIYSSHAQKSADAPDEVLIVEEQEENFVPTQTGGTAQNQQTNNSGTGFQPLPGNPGVEVEPIPGNQPTSTAPADNTANGVTADDAANGTAVDDAGETVLMEEDIISTNPEQ